MNVNDTIRAWKDRGFRKTISQNDVQAHPAGISEIDQAALESISGGTLSNNGCGGPGTGGTPGEPCVF